MYKLHNKIKLGWFEAQINIIEHTNIDYICMTGKFIANN